MIPYFIDWRAISLDLYAEELTQAVRNGLVDLQEAANLLSQETASLPRTWVNRSSLVRVLCRDMDRVSNMLRACPGEGRVIYIDSPQVAAMRAAQ